MNDIDELLRDGNASELASQLRLARKRLEAAVDEVKDWRDSAETIASEVCPTDEKHCGCVLGLRQRLEAEECLLRTVREIAVTHMDPSPPTLGLYIRLIIDGEPIMAALAGEEK
jgi:hypothetical protein